MSFGEHKPPRRRSWIKGEILQGARIQDAFFPLPSLPRESLENANQVLWVPVCSGIWKKGLKASWPLSYIVKWQWKKGDNTSRAERNLINDVDIVLDLPPWLQVPLVNILLSSLLNVFVFWVHTCTQTYQLQEFGYLWCQTVLLKCWAVVRSACWGFWLWKYSKIPNVDSSQFPFWGTGMSRSREDINSELGGSMNLVSGKTCRQPLQITVAKPSFKRDWGFSLILLKRALA